MCHWILREWQCGESYFTKCSSCSFDRAVYGTQLNPLHPTVKPIGQHGEPSCASLSANSTSLHARKMSKSSIASVDLSSRGRTYSQMMRSSPSMVYPRNSQTGQIIPIPLSEIGKASRFGDQASGDEGKCHVFEVVLHYKERTICPACARSPKRAKLPAHARGCFGLS